MSDRDELARDVDPGAYDPLVGNEPRRVSEAAWRKYNAEKIADVLWSAGWRKKPSRDELARVLAVSNGWPLDEWEQIITEPISRTLTYWATADAVLALLDCPTAARQVSDEV